MFNDPTESLTCLSSGSARRNTNASADNPNAKILDREEGRRDSKRDSKRKSSTNSPREFEMRQAKGML